MSLVTIRESFDQLQEVVAYYKNNAVQHEYSSRCIKQDIAFVSQVFGKLQLKMEEIRMNRQFQNYIDKLKPLLNAEQVQRNIQRNKMRLHKASKCTTVQAQKLSIQHICQELGLKCVDPDLLKCYISFEANEFYLDISFNSQAPDSPIEAKVSLVTEGKPEVQPYIAEALIKGDFTTFQSHLRGLMSIFNIPLEPRVRPVLFSALRSLESDLLNMSGMTHDPTPDSVNSSPSGHIIPSRGGVGVQILYFTHTDDVTKPGGDDVTKPGGDDVTKPGGDDVTSLEETAESVLIGVECSSQINQLQTQPLYVRSNEFRHLSQMNSEYVEASFVIKLKRPLIVTVNKTNGLLKKLGNNRLIKPDAVTTTFFELLAPKLNSKDRPEKVLKFGKLNHSYYFPTSSDEKAVEVHRIPFSHPSQIPLIISVLRQQTRYNTLLLSCHDNNSHQSECCHLDVMTTIDITLQPGDSLELVFAHPDQPQLCVLNLDMVDQMVVAKTTDTQKTGVLSSIASKYLSVPLVLHGLLRILSHHFKHQIRPVVTRPEVKESPGYDLESIQLPSPGAPTVTLAPPAIKLEPPPPPPSAPELGTPMLSDQPPILLVPNMPSMSSPFGADSLKTLPSPPDIMAQKRKRPVGCDGDEALLKKVKICDSSIPPNIPSLSPMSGLANIRHQMIGPPSLKPAPILSSSTGGGGMAGNIPCLSPAPPMIRAPIQNKVPNMQNAGVPNLQIKTETDHDLAGDGTM